MSEGKYFLFSLSSEDRSADNTCRPSGSLVRPPETHNEGPLLLSRDVTAISRNFLLFRSVSCVWGGERKPVKVCVCVRNPRQVQSIMGKYWPWVTHESDLRMRRMSYFNLYCPFVSSYSHKKNNCKWDRCNIPIVTLTRQRNNL